ncbi:hypothetical protein [Candidatus Entotheonella palauensis]|uniref:hypothetical protein n=1 Tax=Candidatus Entotheonella palauensis TaxID=93172 RepID=UPI0005514918|nr:hypothetical protein [Candidatus Entotheonella palauensis]
MSYLEVAQVISRVAEEQVGSLDIQLEAIESLGDLAVKNVKIRNVLKNLICRRIDAHTTARAIQLLGPFTRCYEEDFETIYQLANRPGRGAEGERIAALTALGEAIHHSKVQAFFRDIAASRYEKSALRVVAIDQLEKIVRDPSVRTFLIDLFNDLYVAEEIHSKLIRVFISHQDIPEIKEIVVQSARFHRRAKVQRTAQEALS